jgi:hypothetical protein
VATAGRLTGFLQPANTLHTMRPRMTRTTAALAGGLTLLAIVLVLTLSGSPLIVAHANATPASAPILEADSGSGACQAGEALPAGISAIRLTLVAAAGPRVSLSVLSGSRVLMSGVAPSGWTSGAVTVPVKPLSALAAPVSICFQLGRSVETVQLGGSRTSAAIAARSLSGAPLSGRFTVEYMRAGSSSWWSLAKTVARHMGLGHAPSGTWIALLVLVLMGTSVAAASWLIVRELP